MKSANSYKTHASSTLPRAHYRLLELLYSSWPEPGLGGARVVAACSGGCDSMALLELLALASAQCDCRVTAAYVDHGLRPEARDEAAFVGRRARQLGLEFKGLAIDDPGGGDEDHLRNGR